MSGTQLSAFLNYVRSTPDATLYAWEHGPADAAFRHTGRRGQSPANKKLVYAVMLESVFAKTKNGDKPHNVLWYSKDEIARWCSLSPKTLGHILQDLVSDGALLPWQGSPAPLGGDTDAYWVVDLVAERSALRSWYQNRVDDLVDPGSPDLTAFGAAQQTAAREIEAARTRVQAELPDARPTDGNILKVLKGEPLTRWATKRGNSTAKAALRDEIRARMASCGAPDPIGLLERYERDCRLADPRTATAAALRRDLDTGVFDRLASEAAAVPTSSQATVPAPRPAFDDIGAALTRVVNALAAVASDPTSTAANASEAVRDALARWEVEFEADHARPPSAREAVAELDRMVARVPEVVRTAEAAVPGSGDGEIVDADWSEVVLDG